MRWIAYVVVGGLEGSAVSTSEGARLDGGTDTLDHVDGGVRKVYIVLLVSSLIRIRIVIEMVAYERTGDSLALVDVGPEHGTVSSTEGDLLGGNEASHGNEDGGESSSELHFEDWRRGSSRKSAERFCLC